MRLKMKKPLNNDGFTLIEIILALVVLLVIFIPFLKMFSSGYSAQVKAKRITIATSLAREKMEILKSNIYQIPQPEEKQPVEGFIEYQREVLVFPVSGEEDLWLVEVKVYWFERNREQNVRLTTYFLER
jgi:prepilin-type N-terminal cleavage/methylation domain-containing protein